MLKLQLYSALFFRATSSNNSSSFVEAASGVTTLGCKVVQHSHALA